MPQGRRSDHTSSTGNLERSCDGDSVDQQYDALLAGFATGDHGRVELAVGEQRAAVRQQLQAAARRRDLALHFRPGPGRALIFRVEIAEPKLVVTPPARRAPPQQPSPREAASPAPRPPRRPPARDASPPPAPAERPGRRPVAGPPPEQRRSADERRSASERYRSELPRWMRDGRPAGPRREKNGRRSK